MRTAGKILSVILIVSLCLAPFSVSGKKEVKIAFLDSGVSLKHIDPEKVLPGENLVFPESDTSDRIGHGTLAAGIVTGSEELSLPGVSDGAVIVPIVCYDAYPSGVHEKGDGKMLAEGIYKAIDKYDCDIINLSMGITSDDEELKKAVEYAEEKNVVIVAAAGNSNLRGTRKGVLPGALRHGHLRRFGGRGRGGRLFAKRKGGRSGAKKLPFRVQQKLKKAHHRDGDELFSGIYIRRLRKYYRRKRHFAGGKSAREALFSGSPLKKRREHSRRRRLTARNGKDDDKKTYRINKGKLRLLK